MARNKDALARARQSNARRAGRIVQVRASAVEIEENDEAGLQISPRMTPVAVPKRAPLAVQKAVHGATEASHSLKLDPAPPKASMHIGPFKVGRTLRKPLTAFSNMVSAFRAPPLVRDEAALAKARSPKRSVRDVFSDFISGGELEMSAHIRRMDELVEVLEWTVHDPTNNEIVRLHFHDGLSAADDLGAADIYHSLERSMQVFTHLYALRDNFSHAQLSLLKTLKTRLDRYAELRISRPASASSLPSTPASTTFPHAPLDVTVLGGGPIGMRAAVEMALLGHRVTVLEASAHG